MVAAPKLSLFNVTEYVLRPGGKTARTKNEGRLSAPPASMAVTA
jgi:hypothetical protein